MTLTYFSRSLRDLNCQIWAKRCLCAKYLMNQLADFNQICMDITFGHDKSWIGFGDLDLIFKAKFKPKCVCLHVISWTIGWNVTEFASLYKSDRTNGLLEFGDLDLILNVSFMTEIDTIDWFGRWAHLFSLKTQLYFLLYFQLYRW